ncbi:zinc-ribbon domain-containing protein [Cellulophaga baltica]|uniref:zinc-ribbon domain-containing protein n=1 Tax=Cellulophaga baltica TaxID=76594 RepID=UPI0003FBED5D|nr:zinc-ribbon domain-containing protein [Cellulophaga baltica]MBA6313230.1 zinc-ribbon domain-containing protein [Cellulophaga baltica]
MILFFGTRTGKTIQRELKTSSCTFCQQGNTLYFSESSTYFHLFWIKLFKIATTKTIACSHCKKVYYENEFSSEMQQEINSN